MNEKKIKLKYVLDDNDNSLFTTQEPYKPTTTTKRVFDAKTESYKYEEIIINHELELENEIENLQTFFTIERKGDK